MRELAIGLACAAAIGVTACQVQGSCETTPSFVDYCATPNDATCQGQIIHADDGTYWVSGPQNGNFLNFGAQQTYRMHFRDGQTGQLLSGAVLAPPLVQVSATEQGNVPGNSWIECADGLCNFNADLDTSSIWVQNGSCGSYWFRVLVKVSTITSSDAGTD